VSLWTNGVVHWTWKGDLILALLIVLRNLNGCFLNLFGLIKNWRPVRHVYLMEGLIFIPIAVMLAKRHGINGVLLGSLIAHIIATALPSARSAIRIIGYPKHILKAISTAFFLISVASALSFCGVRMNVSASVMLAVAFGVCLPSLLATWQLILPLEIRKEIIARLSKTCSRLGLLLSRAS
jgi:hypothetical protein